MKQPPTRSVSADARPRPRCRSLPEGRTVIRSSLRGRATRCKNRSYWPRFLTAPVLWAPVLWGRRDLDRLAGRRGVALVDPARVGVVPAVVQVVPSHRVLRFEE